MLYVLIVEWRRIAGQDAYISRGPAAKGGIQQATMTQVDDAYFAFQAMPEQTAFASFVSFALPGVDLSELMSAAPVVDVVPVSSPVPTPPNTAQTADAIHTAYMQSVNKGPPMNQLLASLSKASAVASDAIAKQQTPRFHKNLGDQHALAATNSTALAAAAGPSSRRPAPRAPPSPVHLERRAAAKASEIKTTMAYTESPLRRSPNKRPADEEEDMSAPPKPSSPKKTPAEEIVASTKVVLPVKNKSNKRISTKIADATEDPEEMAALVASTKTVLPAKKRIASSESEEEEQPPIKKSKGKSKKVRFDTETPRPGIVEEEVVELRGSAPSFCCRICTSPHETLAEYNRHLNAKHAMPYLAGLVKLHESLQDTQLQQCSSLEESIATLQSKLDAAKSKLNGIHLTQQTQIVSLVRDTAANDPWIKLLMGV